jgi:uncharacterized membrane protein YeaQ/YmgE (transglycosylase-associated protein family)
MKMPLDPSHFELPMSLATCVLGAALSVLGLVGATVAGWYVSLASIDPQELAIQPLHVVLIGFIVALATFIVLILRAVWGRGIDTVNRFSSALDNQAAAIDNQSKQIAELIDLQTKRVEKLEGLSFDVLRTSASHERNPH